MVLQTLKDLESYFIVSLEIFKMAIIYVDTLQDFYHYFIIEL